MLSPQEVVDTLRSHGYKVTPQRLAVYHALSHTTEHPTAETLYKTLNPLFPTMSLATVYKTLTILCHVGLAQELNVGEDFFRYDARVEHHPHIRCVKCGRVDDVSHLDDKKVTSSVAAETGYDVTDHQFYFFGICPACRKALH